MPDMKFDQILEIMVKKIFFRKSKQPRSLVSFLTYLIESAENDTKQGAIGWFIKQDCAEWQLQKSLDTAQKLMVDVYNSLEDKKITTLIKNMIKFWEFISKYIILSNWRDMGGVTKQLITKIINNWDIESKNKVYDDVLDDFEKYNEEKSKRKAKKAKDRAIE